MVASAALSGAQRLHANGAKCYQFDLILSLQMGLLFWCYPYIPVKLQSKFIPFSLQAEAMFNYFNILNSKIYQAATEITGILRPFQDMTSFCYI